ncbi:DUF2158 domain-containing protein [Roseateles agri]|uniref:DUF2158 domain-containing protein n=1 Tax=Roseateles agri TaxID=3098619 RepID=UPI003D6683BE
MLRRWARVGTTALQAPRVTSLAPNPAHVAGENARFCRETVLQTRARGCNILRASDARLAMNDPSVIVSLKAGGPLMSIMEIREFHGREHALCTWVDASSSVQTRYFPLELLVRESETSPDTPFANS